jgi:hypothetical protein
MRIKDLDKIRNEMFDLLPAYLPAVVLFILMPFALYLPNQSILNNNLTLVIPYLVLAIVYFIFPIALLFFVGQPLRTRIVVVLFYIGVYLGLSDVMAPIQLGQLMSGRETPTESLFLNVVEVALAVAVIFCAIKLPWRWVNRFGSIFVALLLVSEAIVVFNGLSPETRLQFTNVSEKTKVVEKYLSDPPEKLADRGNVYHITFDAYSGAIFLESLEEMKLIEEFDGFTFFEKTRSNYDWTMVSVPSYLTGAFYEENSSLKDWMRSRYKNSGIANDLYGAGYEISMYAPYNWWINYKASHLKINEDMLMQHKSLSSFSHLADLWLLRVVPNFLQQEIYREGKGVFTRLFVKEGPEGLDARPVATVELMRELINDEADRPDHGQYVYTHFYLPHTPYVMNRDCVFVQDGSNYEEQTLCSTRLMVELFSKLKEIGRYHESTIIIQSDHGTLGTKNPDYDMLLEVEKKVDALNIGGLPASKINDHTHALLLIKPPSHSGKPLVISNRSTQLVDIPATIYDLLDLPVHTKEGMSVFSPEFTDSREIHIFYGFMQITEKGGVKEISELHEGQVGHLSFTDGKGWRIYPNIHVRWE